MRHIKNNDVTDSWQILGIAHNFVFVLNIFCRQLSEFYISFDRFQDMKTDFGDALIIEDVIEGIKRFIFQLLENDNSKIFE